MRKLLPILLLLPLYAASCRTGATEAGLSFSPKALVRTAGPNCQGGEKGKCILVQILYPQAAGANKKLVNALNEQIEKTVQTSAAVANPTDGSPSDLESNIELLLTDYQELLDAAPDYTLNWYLSISGTPHLVNDKVVSIEIRTNAFTGGASPLHFTRFVNLDAQTGQLLETAQLISDAQGLTQLAEKAYRSAHGILDTDTIPFRLPAQIGWKDSGMFLVVQEHEAPPLRDGFTDILLPYDQLVNLVTLDRIR